MKRLLSLLLTFLLAGAPAFASSFADISGRPSNTATYAANSGYISPAASTTDLVAQIGSSTKTVKILKVFMNYEVSAAVIAPARFFIVKRSSANTGGTSATFTSVPLDSTAAAATSVIRSYTANPAALGTTVGTVASLSTIPAIVQNGSGPITPPVGATVLFDADKYGSALVLRGVAEQMSINCAGTQPVGTSPVVQFTVIYTES